MPKSLTNPHREDRLKSLFLIEKNQTIIKIKFRTHKQHYI